MTEMFDQPYVELLFIGFALRAIGFLVRDELLLRALVFVGTLFDIAFYALQSPSIWGAVATNSIMIALYLTMIAIIIVERTSLFMSRKDKAVFTFFKTLSPGQFRRINRWARWSVATEDTVILREGERAGQLFFIHGDEFFVVKQGVRYSARGPAFAGEIMLLQGGVASASVIVPKGCVYAIWQTDKLRAAMGKNRALENALVARFGHDLADKVRNSVPLAQRDPILSPQSAEIHALPVSGRASGGT